MFNVVLTMLYYNNHPLSNICLMNGQMQGFVTASFRKEVARVSTREQSKGMKFLWCPGYFDKPFLSFLFIKNCLLVSVQMILLIIRLFIYLAFHFFALAIRFYSYLKKYLSHSFGSTIIFNAEVNSFQRVVLQCCTIIITPVVK